MTMMQVIIKVQRCTSYGNRVKYAFVGRSQEAHGIAKGDVRFKLVVGRNWAAIKRAVNGASYDGRTMGATNISPKTVEAYRSVNYPGMSPTETRFGPVQIADVVAARQRWAIDGTRTPFLHQGQGGLRLRVEGQA